MADIELRVTSTKERLAYGEPLTLQYEVVNRSAQDIFLVQRQPIAHVSTNSPATGTLEIELAERPAPEGLSYYAYRRPRLNRLPVGERKSARLTLAMPPRESSVTFAGLELKEQPISGEVNVVLKIGYTLEPISSIALAESGDPLHEFRKHQHIVASSLQISVASPQG